MKRAALLPLSFYTQSNNMTISQKGIDLIKFFEGFRSKSYQDIAGIWTIGYGSTMWTDGSKVKSGQIISEPDAMKLLQWEVKNKTAVINSLTEKISLTQNQYDALCSFVYNVGVGGFGKSTMLKKMKLNPNDPTIRAEFLKWNKITKNGVKVESEGLTNRRNKEADLYFSK
jgi:lysozyme